MNTVEQPLQQHKQSVSFSGIGEIYSYTVLQDPPKGHEEQAPLVIAYVRLDEGPMVTAQLTDLDGEPQIGDRVEMVTRKLTTEGDNGLIIYGYKFRKQLFT